MDYTRVSALCIFICLIFSQIEFGQSWVSIGRGPCPDEHKGGESWFGPGCQRCDCDASGESWSCYGCGVYAIDIDNENCYIHHHTELDYPKCCTPHTKCR